MNFNFNSSSEHLSEDVAVLHPRPYKQKLKPPITKKPTYKAILNDLERRLQTMNKQGRVKSSSGSVSTTYNTKKYPLPFTLSQALGSPGHSPAAPLQDSEE